MSRIDLSRRLERLEASGTDTTPLIVFVGLAGQAERDRMVSEAEASNPGRPVMVVHWGAAPNEAA